MSERDDRPAAEETREGQQEHLVQEMGEGATPGTVGALDGAAAAGSIGGTSAARSDSELPQGAPDPSIGPD